MIKFTEFYNRYRPLLVKASNWFFLPKKVKLVINTIVEVLDSVLLLSNPNETSYSSTMKKEYKFIGDIMVNEIK